MGEAEEVERPGFRPFVVPTPRFPSLADLVVVLAISQLTELGWRQHNKAKRSECQVNNTVKIPAPLSPFSVCAINQH